MRRRTATVASALVLVLLASGCAVGRVRHSPGCGRDVACVAVGHARCEIKPDGTAVIRGGALSNNMSEAVGTLITAASAAFGLWMGGALP